MYEFQDFLTLQGWAIVAELIVYSGQFYTCTGDVKFSIHNKTVNVPSGFIFL